MNRLRRRIRTFVCGRLWVFWRTADPGHAAPFPRCRTPVLFQGLDTYPAALTGHSQAARILHCRAHMRGSAISRGSVAWCSDTTREETDDPRSAAPGRSNSGCTSQVEGDGWALTRATVSQSETCDRPRAHSLTFATRCRDGAECQKRLGDRLVRSPGEQQRRLLPR